MLENWETQETPRQRITRLRKQVEYWRCHGDSRYCEPEICYFCQHFRYYHYDEGGSDCDCGVRAPKWLAGDSPILHCRKFKAVKDWRFQCERHLNLVLADVVKDLTGRLTVTSKERPLTPNPPKPAFCGVDDGDEDD